MQKTMKNQPATLGELLTVRSSLHALVLALLLFTPSITHADAPTAAEVAIASSLFAEARVLYDKGKIAEALVKYEASNQIEPTSGKLLNIARCHEKLEHFSSAVGALDLAILYAQKEGSTDRLAYATAHKKELEPKISRLKLEIDPEAFASNIKLDGKVLPDGALDVAIPVDAGKHVVTADREGAEPFRTTVDVKDPGETTITKIPPAPKKVKETPPIVPPPPPYWNGQRIGAVSLGGFGIATIVVGSVFGVDAKKAMDQSQPHCWDSDPDLCDAKGVALRDRATTSAWVSNIGIGLGVASIAGGVLLFALASPKEPPTGTKGAPTIALVPLVGPGSFGGSAMGRF